MGIQIGQIFPGQRQVTDLAAPLMWWSFVAPTTGAVTLVRSHASLHTQLSLVIQRLQNRRHCAVAAQLREQVFGNLFIGVYPRKIHQAKGPLERVARPMGGNHRGVHVLRTAPALTHHIGRLPEDREG